MNQIDLIILVVYTITVILVLKRAIESVDQVTAIAFNKAALQEALKERKLAGKLGVSFALPGRYPLGSQPKELAVIIANKLERAIYIDWDRSTFTDLKGRSRRVIRLSSNKGAQINAPQVLSPIPPGRTLEEKITAEDTLVRDGDGVKVKKPLINIKRLAEEESVNFSLWLVVHLQETDEFDDRTCVLPCEFTVRRCPWTDSLPF